MRTFRYPDEENGELVYKTITEQEILNQFHDFHNKILTEIGQPEASKESTLQFFINTHLAQEIK